MNTNTSELRSPRRKLLFAITLLFPLLLFVLVEGMLRIFGYGGSLALFNKEEINGKQYYVINPKVSARYFSSVDFNPSLAPDYFAVEKPDTTYRIFCLGGSTTAGFPYQFGGSFVSFLRERLHAMFPERKIEVVNLGMTATNSFTVLDIAEELFAYKPDLLVIYDGHNEFYGALGIASHETGAASRTLTRLYLKLINLKSFLLLRNIYLKTAALFGKAPDTPASGTMMERLARGQYIRYGSEKYFAALATFRQNLEDVKASCRKHNVPVLVGGQVSNLRDQPPFISHESDSLTAERKEELGRALRSGAQAFDSSRFADARGHFQHAVTIDSFRADVHYKLARCLDTLGKKADALREYVKARDLDMLRFRASSDFNDAIRDVCDDTTMIFVDVERKFKANSTDSLIGNSLILEHLHPNSRGAFLIAKEYQWMMHWHKLMATEEQWNDRTVVTDDRVWQERTVTELDERAARKRVEILTSGWPFSEYDKPLSAPVADDTLGQIVEALVHGKVSWERAHVEAAQYYAARGEYENEAKEYRVLMKLLPLNVSPYLFLAKAYLNQQKNLDAASALLQSTEVEKTWFAYKTLGILALDAAVAEAFYLKSLDVAQTASERAESHFLLASVYNFEQKYEQAVRHLRESLTQKPGFQPAQDLLQKLMSRQ
jgi:tetratricopeptide (TPR) repeat protein